MPTLYNRIQDGVVSVMQNDSVLGDLGEIPGGINKFVRDDLTNVVFPCITVSFEGMTPRPLPGDTEFWHNEYPLLVFIRDQTELRENQGDSSKYLSWWKSIVNLFSQRKRDSDWFVIPGAIEVYSSSVNPRPVLDQKYQQYPNLVSAIELRFQAAEQRQ